MGLFSRTRDAQHLADRYRPVLDDQGVHQFRSNLALVNAGGKELFTKFLPELQTQLGLSDRLAGSVLPLVAILVVGIGLVFGPLALGWFGKTDAADQVAQAARGPFSVAVSDATVNDTFSFNAAFIEMRKALFPAIAQKLGMSDAEVDAYLHKTYPALLKFLDKWDASIYKGARALSLSQIQYMDEFHNADATPYKALPWLFMAPGAVLLVGAAYGFASRRRRDATADTEPTGGGS